jgi:hypothetical protein
MLFVAFVLCTLMLTPYAYYRSTYQGSTHWVSFWFREVIIGVLLIYGIVEFIRKAPKL